MVTSEATAIGVLGLLFGLECREENRPFSGQQHQTQFGFFNPALQYCTVRRHWLQAKTKCQWGLQQLCKSCKICFMLLHVLFYL